ncbi:Hsp20/alpha crystallin family protein [Agriterribacter sp.]|uniref:Hsp20/alpha crystallin family protein n=1 Tax=Agriterribacter sp. TaxID=2821509 RepID=UPI002B7B7AFB|nr:Hsp20/alpha crystallin family protein [Agriterribacter sp.]HRO46672.1 Hsp20/alpha crystallin family protein [Agriterribacter sp.]HRQ16988.1 Hsp20/alpha crystallin family protein [Agriterribacter sp.]
MNTRTLAKRRERMPSLSGDFFNKSLLDLFDDGFSSRVMNVPAVNIVERKDDYLVSMAAPGLKKEDFKIDVEGDLLAVRSEKEEENEEKDEKYTRREYSYSSFERSFTLPDEVNKDKIDAHYQDGVLKLVLPKKEEAKKMAISKQITVK